MCLLLWSEPSRLLFSSPVLESDGFLVFFVTRPKWTRDEGGFHKHCDKGDHTIEPLNTIVKLRFHAESNLQTMNYFFFIKTQKKVAMS